MKKYIHYCWFGDKPLPKLAKKCIRSWKKYLPDFEIIKWSEDNVDLNECSFIKEAYEKKKWAFVADYVRAKALYEMGGLYFDTDMEVTASIDDILKENSFLGVEDSGKIAVGAWWESSDKSNLSKKLLEYYRSQEGFDENNTFSFSIPVLVTDILEKEGFKENLQEIQKINNGMVIYPRDYFYPLSYDRQNNVFTTNTCMIHYYDASRVPKYEQREIKIYRIMGRKNGARFIKMCRLLKRVIKKTLKIMLFPIVIYRNKKRIRKYIDSSILDFDEQYNKIKDKNVLAFYRKEWLGTSYATKETFENSIGITSTNNPKICDYYAQKIVDAKCRLVIFSAFDISWKKLVNSILEKKPNQNIKIVWHGSNAMNIEDYDWKILKTILDFSKQNKIVSIGFVKKSMYEFYKEKGYNVEFLMNTLSLDKNIEKKKLKKKDDNKIHIGVYASGDRWVKNFYNQLSAASLIKKHKIDCIPLSYKTVEFGKYIGANITGISKSIPREELLERLASNDINIYVTFVECAPLLPLESLELGVPCITSNNHHYWEGTELEKYLIVNAPDNIIEIKEKIEYVLNKKEKIIDLYNKWKKEYDKKAKKTIKEFTK